MSSATSDTGDAAGGEAAGSPDFDTLKKHVKTLRDDIGALLRDAGAVLQDQAKAYAAKSRAQAGEAGSKAGEYKEAVKDKVRDHPLAAVGIALAAGLVLSSLSRK